MSDGFKWGLVAGMLVSACALGGYKIYEAGQNAGIEAERQRVSAKVSTAFARAQSEVRDEAYAAEQERRERDTQKVQDYLQERGMAARHVGDCWYQIEDRSGAPVTLEMENGKPAETFLCGLSGGNGFELGIVPVSEREESMPKVAREFDVSKKAIKATFGSLPDIMAEMQSHRKSLIVQEKRSIDRLVRAQDIADPYATPDTPSSRGRFVSERNAVQF